MITSRLSSKAQTTIPRSVRTVLRLHEGDTLQYEIVDDHVILKKGNATSLEDPFVAFDEWDSEADRRAYADL
ncbi:MAG: AbrB/MazE/SpoVT family DNA-binding domain-containing protein [Trueperaceae bacterium]